MTAPTLEDLAALSAKATPGPWEASEDWFTTDDLREVMEGKVWLESKAMSLLDEIPMAYKDIDVVMEDQKDLVATEHVLHQVLNFKGC